jgi:hypothetical protein
MNVDEVKVDEKKYFYKFAGPDCVPLVGKGRYFPPRTGKPGKWHPRIRDLRLCRSGYHVSPARNLITETCPAFLGSELYIVEVRGASVSNPKKAAFEQMRFIRKLWEWNDAAEAWFFCDCAARVRHIYEAAMPGDDRLRRAIAKMRVLIRSGDAARRGEEWDILRIRAASAFLDTFSGTRIKSDPHRAAGYAARAVVSAAQGERGAVLNDAAMAVALAAAGDTSRASFASSCRLLAMEREWQVKRFGKYAEGVKIGPAGRAKTEERAKAAAGDDK